MSRVLLDTHVLLWLLGQPERLGSKARAFLERAQTQGALHVSAMSFWEIAMLVEKGAIKLRASASQWRADALRHGVHEVPVDGEIAIRATEVLGSQGDPADRLIVATALLLEATLVTADQTLLGWRSRLKRQDASR